jgi:predicted enzyme related to lactoylglutathione lyase
MADSHGRFVWYELTTTDTEAATTFYAKVVGWGTQDASMPGAAYTLFTAGDASVGGLQGLPEGLRKMGVAPRWIGYVGVDDVGATAERIARLGGAVHVPPTDVPNISRFSIVADPQGATLALFKWLTPGQQQRAAPGTAGRVGWHELLAADWRKAFAFYGELFGWQKVGTDIGATGSYQLFATGGQTIGGMSTKPAAVSMPFWLYYFNVDDIDAAAERVTAGGGRILEGPTQALGGGWIVRCVDPQGAMFALTGTRSRKAVGYFEPVAADDPSAARFFVPKKVAPHAAAAAASAEMLLFRAATDGKLADRAFDMEFDAGHFREQIDIGGPDCTAAEAHIGRHQIERLHQYADVLEDKRVSDRAVFP